ncbi:MAG TPA: hypothetical protein PLP16_03925, partial [Smithellaceae bacterium]|nr:hypothetical protein [Smithellaceae bacterium]
GQDSIPLRGTYHGPPGYEILGRVHHTTFGVVWVKILNPCRRHIPPEGQGSVRRALQFSRPDELYYT